MRDVSVIREPVFKLERSLPESDDLIDQWDGQLLRLDIDHKNPSVSERLQRQVALSHQLERDDFLRSIDESRGLCGEYLLQQRCAQGCEQDDVPLAQAG